MSPLAAHLVCLALVAADLVARAWRIQWILRGIGQRITFGEAFTLNALGDAACAVTPLRLGGEPARLAGMLRARVPAAAAAIAILFEVLWAWPVIIVSAGALAWRFAPDWWRTVAPRVLGAATTWWPALAVVAVVTVAAWIYGVRLAKRLGTTHEPHPLRRAAEFWRQMKLWPLVASIPLSFVNLATRVAILPVLAMTLPHPPPMGPAALGSFALLYSQLILPTPSGAGAVDVGFLGGVAGDLGAEHGWLLLAWRFYTNGVGVVLGAILAIRSYGWPALRAAIRRFAPDAG